MPLPMCELYKEVLAHVKRLWRVQTLYLGVHMAWNKAVAILTREFPLFRFLIISRGYLCFTALSGVAFCFFSAMTNKFLITLSTHVIPLLARPASSGHVIRLLMCVLRVTGWEVTQHVIPVHAIATRSGLVKHLWRVQAQWTHLQGVLMFHCLVWSSLLLLLCHDE